jgi:serine/threonine protein kinase
MIKQITEIGIKLRQINVAHNDLKPSQFIYFASQQRIKLNDFGSALYEGNQFNHFYNFKVSLR